MTENKLDEEVLKGLAQHESGEPDILAAKRLALQDATKRLLDLYSIGAAANQAYEALAKDRENGVDGAQVELEVSVSPRVVALRNELGHIRLEAVRSAATTNPSARSAAALEQECERLLVEATENARSSISAAHVARAHERVEDNHRQVQVLVDETARLSSEMNELAKKVDEFQRLKATESRLRQRIGELTNRGDTLMFELQNMANDIHIVARARSL
jgi:predicted RNase H-like nuclease (RuvC/YqgF family)